MSKTNDMKRGMFAIVLDGKYFEKILIEQNVHFRDIRQINIEKCVDLHMQELNDYYKAVVKYEKSTTREVDEMRFTIKQMSMDPSPRFREQALREVMMYRSVLPLMASALRSAGLFSPLTPKYYDSNVGRRFVLMEDFVSGESYKEIHAKKRLSFDEMKLTFTALARWHAASLKIMNQLTKVQLNRLMDNHSSKDKDMHMLDMLMLNSFECCIEMLEKEEGYKDISKKLLKLKQTSPAKFLEARKFSFGGINVIGHGDLCSYSVLFPNESYNGEQLPVFHELQMASLQSPVFDVASLLFSSADPAIDNVGYDRLIDFYADQLVKAQKILAVPESRIITNVDVFREFDHRSCSAIMYSICTMPLRFQTKPEHPDAFWTKFFDGSECGEEFRKLVFNDEVTKKCIKNLLRYADRSGYLSLQKDG